MDREYIRFPSGRSVKELKPRSKGVSIAPEAGGMDDRGPFLADKERTRFEFGMVYPRTAKIVVGA